MSLGARTLRWDAVDPFLAGPERIPAGSAVTPFDVAAPSSSDLCIGHIRSGAGWPSDLPGVDRLAAAPLPAADLDAETDAQVLTFETSSGAKRTLCARTPAGAVRWSIDPTTWIRALLDEAYVSSWRRPLVSRVPIVNYSRAPHALKALLQRFQSPLAGHASSPVAFPVIPVDDLVEVIRGLCRVLACPVAGTPPSPWPDGCEAAVTLTHDVDTEWILEPAREGLLREIVDTELSLGFRGAWYVTASRLSRRHRDALRVLADAGHEVGAHGWNHDARLQYLSETGQERRIALIRARFEDLGCSLEGMRTPWYARGDRLFDVLARHFSYDTSVPNASGFFSSRTNSGCCTVLPYRPRPGLIELPMTLPPDTAIDPRSGYPQIEAAARGIAEQRGVVVVTLHPQPHQSASRAGLDRYFLFLKRLATNRQLWHATPLEIARHYASALTRSSGTQAATHHGGGIAP